MQLTATILIALSTVLGALLEWVPSEPHPARWGVLAVAYLAGGGRIARDSWITLREQHKLSIDFLMAIAAAGAAVVGRPLEGAILILLFSISNTLETYAMGRTRRAIRDLIDLRPTEATLADDAGRELARVPVDELVPGQQVLIRPGERIAADGKVVSGRSAVNQAAITGESVPVTRLPGDDVYAGTINQGGVLVVRVTRDAGETMLARIIRLVEEAREQRAPTQHFIDRFAHPYTLAVLLAAALVTVVPAMLLDVAWQSSFYRAMTLLLAASPCALVVSTPSAILSGIANGARHGILFKGGAYLDIAGTIDTVAFDKTGTLTFGAPQLRELVTTAALQRELDGEPVDPTSTASEEASLIALAAAVERTSEHHLARAVMAAVNTREIDVPQVSDFVAIPGEGVAGRVGGRNIWVGNSALAQRLNVRVDAVLRGWIAEQTSLARSVVYVGADMQVLGAMSFADALKPNAAATVRHLKYEGVRWIAVLSGDHPDAVRAIAAELGADEVHAGLLPHAKVDAVRALNTSARGVAMVGDGVNDAPAMAAARLGIAMGAAGTDVAIETADVVLMSDDIEKVDYVIHLGKRARRVVRQNVYFSVGWMLLLVVVALTIGMPLTLAVVAHEGSTLLVVANGLRLLAGRPHPPLVPGQSGVTTAVQSTAHPAPAAAVGAGAVHTSRP